MNLRNKAQKSIMMHSPMYKREIAASESILSAYHQCHQGRLPSNAASPYLPASFETQTEWPFAASRCCSSATGSRQWHQPPGGYTLLLSSTAAAPVQPSSSGHLLEAIALCLLPPSCFGTILPHGLHAAEC